MGLLRFLLGPDHEVRQLNRDARTVVEMAEQSYSRPTIRTIVALARDELVRTDEILVKSPGSEDEVLRRLRSMHQDSRRAYQQAELTAYTLAIIHLRSRAHGDATAPAREAIEGFLVRWEMAGDADEVEHPF